MNNTQEKWLDKHTIACGRFSARLTPQACARYAADDPDACKGCARLTAAADDTPKVCSDEGCEKPHYARGYCRMHYARRRYAGGKVRTAPRGCQVAGCQEPHCAKGYCKAHYQRLVSYPRKAKTDGSLNLKFSGKERALLERLTRMAAANGNSIEAEAKIYITACLDYYEERT